MTSLSEYKNINNQIDLETRSTLSTPNSNTTIINTTDNNPTKLKHMQSQDKLNVKGRTIISFNSNSVMPLNILSNFNGCEITFDEIIYPSSEHAFQAHLIPKDKRNMYSVAGPYSKLNIETFRIFFPKLTDEKLINKVKYWERKSNVGILAKMASKPAHLSKHHGLVRTMISKEDAEELFKSILVCKFEQYPKFRNLIINTGTSYILEFDKSATRLEEKGLTSRWGGMIVNDMVVGNNQMGVLMMWLRDRSDSV